MADSESSKLADAWRAAQAKLPPDALKESRPNFATLSGIPVERLFLPKGTEFDEYESKLGFPGVYPFTRGVQPTMYRGRYWTMRQYSGFATCEETNKRYRYLLDRGQTGLSVAFDLPTQMGHDSDAPESEGEVGKCGVAISTLDDMEVLFDSIPLDKVSTSMTINATAPVLLAMYVALAEKSGVSPALLNGTVQNDILKEYVARGAYIFPPGPSIRLATDLFEFCMKKVPKWNMISISGYHIREAGSTAAQELGFTLANGICYVEEAVKRGFKVDSFAPRLSFFFNAHNNLFEEVAKFRAARRMWAKIMKERFGAKNDKSMMLRFHTQTAGCTLTAQQPENNVMRVAYQALAAVLGGTQSLHTNSRDEALSLPTEESVNIALRTQQIIAHETGVGDTVDPLGGSYYVEALTDELERLATDYISQVDKLGGSVAAIEKGYFQKEILNSAYDYQRKIESKERVIVGVNQFQEKKPAETLRPLKVDPSVRERQSERIRDFRKRRDAAALNAALKDLEVKAGSPSENLMEPILASVKSGATLGEICGVLRRVFGEYRSKTTL